MPSPQQPAKAAKRQTVYSAFTDTWSEARARRATRERVINERREKRRKPQPWILRKLAVGFVIAILLWLQYVYVGRLCVPMIRRDDGARGTLGQGIAYLIVFEILWLITVWGYLTVVSVPPGFARDYVKKTPPPNEMQQTRTDSPETTAPSTQRESSDMAPLRPVQPALPRSSSQSQPHVEKRPANAGSPPSSFRSGRSRNGPVEFPENNPIARPFGKTAGTAEADAVSGPAKVHVAPANGVAALKRPDLAVRPSWDDAAPPSTADETWAEHLPPSRRPNHPVLTPERRYCYKDEQVKPYRSHHCSTCATDVLMFDHHCIWVGQCIGARNRKFFVNFLEWGVLTCLWLFVTLIIATAGPAFAGDLDGEMIAMIAISGFFLFFTGTLLMSHAWMLTINATTVEHLWMQTLQHRDTAALNVKYSIWNVVAKGRERQKWNDEWGSLYTEGNIWWLGSRRKNWEATMGQNKWWWFLPIGRSQSDGLTYAVNPRFASDGRWRRRSEWPVELQ